MDKSFALITRRELSTTFYPVKHSLPTQSGSCTKQRKGEAVHVDFDNTKAARGSHDDAERLEQARKSALLPSPTDQVTQNKSLRGPARTGDFPPLGALPKRCGIEGTLPFFGPWRKVFAVMARPLQPSMLPTPSAPGLQITFCLFVFLLQSRACSSQPEWFRKREKTP